MTSALRNLALAGKPVRRFPVYDAHAHIGDWAIFDTVPLAEQVAEMDRLGIRAAAVSGLPALAGEYRRGNDLVAAAMRRHPGRFIGYAHVSAKEPEAMVPELKRCFANPDFRGIKLYQVGVPYDDPLFAPVYAFAAARRAPVLAHTWGGNLTGFDAAAAAHPDVTFLAAHAGSDWSHRAYVAAARRASNLYLDLTYSRDCAGMLEYFVAEVGAARIVWGSDGNLFSMAQQLAKVLCARIPDAAKQTILSRNPARLFRLPVR